MSEAKTPEVGEWWLDDLGDIGQVVFKVDDEEHELPLFMVVYRWEDGDYTSAWVMRRQLVKHLPSCTGFDYEPPADAMTKERAK